MLLKEQRNLFFTDEPTFSVVLYYRRLNCLVYILLVLCYCSITGSYIGNPLKRIPMFCELSMNLKISLTEQLWNIIVAVYSNYSEIYIYSKWVESTFLGWVGYLVWKGNFFLVLRIWDIYPRSKFFPCWIPDPHQRIEVF